MLVATVKATGERFAVRYDLRTSIDPVTHREVKGGGVRCWGRLVGYSGRTNKATFAAGEERTYQASEVEVQELPRYNALRSLTLVPGTHWK